MRFVACNSHVMIIFNLFLKISVVLTSFHGQRRTVLLANTQLTMIFFGNDHHRTYIAQYSHSEKFTNCLSFLSQQEDFFFPFFHCLTTIEISGSFCLLHTSCSGWMLPKKKGSMENSSNSKNLASNKQLLLVAFQLSVQKRLNKIFFEVFSS